MRSQVISTGKRLYCGDRLACERFEDYVYAAYARLNEERRGILEDIRQRGTICSPVVDDLLLNKSASIERCLGQIADEYNSCKNEFENDHTRQDSIVLNLQRACEAAIDAAMHQARVKGSEFPRKAEMYFACWKAGLLTIELSSHMQAMVGFRNVAVHGYQKRSLAIVEAILNERLDDFRRFAKVMVLI